MNKTELELCYHDGPDCFHQYLGKKMTSKIFLKKATRTSSII